MPQDISIHGYEVTAIYSDNRYRYVFVCWRLAAYHMLLQYMVKAALKTTQSDGQVRATIPCLSA